MTITLKPDATAKPVRKITLVIDRNPAPISAVFTLGEKSGINRISTRFRVNSYTKVHVVAETGDGKLHVAEKFVKASGGCSAPAGKDPAEAKANMGKMKLRQFATPDGRREAADAASPQPFRIPDGPDHPLLHAGHVHPRADDQAGRRPPVRGRAASRCRRTPISGSITRPMARTSSRWRRWIPTSTGSRGVSRRNHQPIGLRR